ncbi:YrzI family small protein [Bacillus sp. B1-b2]|nr:YrzI family small protein [Bacillus sp. B1-b2]KAB7667257.1 YrzI family small protein [Bacillus sp. B1-b2]
MIINMLFFTITIRNKPKSEEQMIHEEQIEKLMEETKRKHVNILPYM